MISNKRDVLERQSLSEVKMGRGSPICEMPATGLKIVGTAACLPWCSISSSFQNSLKTSGHRGYEFWCWNLVPFLPDIGFQLLKSLWYSLMYFSFNDVQNVLYG